MDYSPPGSSAHGILRARILEWVAIRFSWGLSDPGIVPTFLASPTLAGEFSTTAPSGKPCTYMVIPDDSPNPCMPHSEHRSLISEESSQLFLSVESSTWFHCKSAFLLSLGLLVNILVIYQWKWNIIQESTFQGCHTLIIQKGLQQGQILFIMSEILFFFFVVFAVVFTTIKWYSSFCL